MKRKRLASVFGLLLGIGVLTSLAGPMEVKADNPNLLVNGDFSYPSGIRWDNTYSSLLSGGEAWSTYFYPDTEYTNVIGTQWKGFLDSMQIYHVPGYNAASFGWHSVTGSSGGKPFGIVELQQSGSGNRYVEVNTDSLINEAVYQDFACQGDSVVYWSMWHAPRGRSYPVNNTYYNADNLKIYIGNTQSGESLSTWEDRVSDGTNDVYATRIHSNGSSPLAGSFYSGVITAKPDNTTFAPWEQYEGKQWIGGGSGTVNARIMFRNRSNTNDHATRDSTLVDDVYITQCYKLTFHSNGGSDIGFDAKANHYAGYLVPGKATSISSLTRSVPVRAGYTFLGWSERQMGPLTSKAQWDSAKSSITDTITMTTGGKTVYAVWGKNPTVTFKNQGSVVGTTTTTFGGTPSTPGTPSRTGYDFAGWNPNPGTPVYSDLVSEATWNPRTYTIYFDKNNPGTALTDGSNISLGATSKTAKYDSPWGTLPGATKTGYQFLGWFTARSGGSQVTQNTICKGDATVYAQWKPIEYVVTLLPNAEHAGTNPTVTGTMPSMRLTYDVPQAIPTNQFVKTTVVPSEDDGGPNVTKPSVFQGWSADPAAITPAYGDGGTLLNLTPTNGGTVTLYAIWDDAPSFVLARYPDRYFTLEEANTGVITEEELLRTVEVYDRESNPLLPVPGGGNTPGITVVNYDPDDFTLLTDDADVLTRYKVTDAAGNTAFLNIVVHVSRTETIETAAASYFRSISNTYKEEAPIDGGLSDTSRWKSDTLYENSLNSAFTGTNRYDIRLNKEQLSEIRAYIASKGFGNSMSDSALAELWTKVTGY